MEMTNGSRLSTGKNVEKQEVSRVGSNPRTRWLCEFSEISVYPDSETREGR
jgi:hypothetical protein